MKLDIDTLAANERDMLEQGFMDRQAARLLAGLDGQSDEATSQGTQGAADNGTLTHAVLAAMSGTGSLDSIYRATQTLPLAIVPLVRALATRRSRAGSLGARAASTDDGPVRDLGDATLSLVEEDDALFVIIELGGDLLAAPPAHLRSLGADGEIQSFDLPEPIGATLQFGLDRASPGYDAQRRVLFDPSTALFLD